MYYIHIPDPTYAEEGDFPFGRRLGPFLTEEEAINQAVSDVAGGGGSVLGIYDEDESEKMRDGGEGESARTKEDIDDLADVERKKREAEQAVLSDPAMEAQWAVLEEANKDNPAMAEIITYLKGRTM